MNRIKIGNERRHFKRYKVDDIHGSFRSARDLVVRDISLTGLSVETTVPLRISEVYTFKMTGRHDAVEVPAEVRWCSLVDVRSASGGAENVYHAGLDFTDALEDKAQELLGFIEGHVVIDLKERLSGKLRDHEAPIELDARHAFLVRSVSYSGIEIETEAAHLPARNTIVEIELTDARLPLECAARVAEIGSRHGDRRGVRLEFQDLSIDGSLALDYFIRTVLE